MGRKSKKKNIPRFIPFPEDIPQLEYAQIFTASSVWYEMGRRNDIATFDLVVREMPGDRNFMLLGGVEEIIRRLLAWHYDSAYVDELIAVGCVSRAYGAYLKRFRFKGEVWSLPEGSICFPGEPVVRITAPLIDANLFPVFLTTAISYPTLYLSKAVRVKLAARNKKIIIAGGTRALSFENIVKAHRLSFFLSNTTAIPYIFPYMFGLKRKLTPEITFYHALIKSFPNELEAFRSILASSKPDVDTTVMVDTYNVRRGVDHFITVEKEANKKGRTLGWLLIDSGDLLVLSKWIRRKLDSAGLKSIKIAAASNLDERKIAAMERCGSPIDVYATITELMNVADRPVLEAVYKLATVECSDGSVQHTAKLTPGKLSLPGKKQVFRTFGRDGKMKGDVIGLENEKLGRPLLERYIKNGKLVRKLPTLDEIKKHLEKELVVLPAKLKNVERTYPYPVRVSSRVRSILEKLKRDHLRPRT